MILGLPAGAAWRRSTARHSGRQMYSALRVSLVACYPVNSAQHLAFIAARSREFCSPLIRRGAWGPLPGRHRQQGGISRSPPCGGLLACPAQECKRHRARAATAVCEVPPRGDAPKCSPTVGRNRSTLARTWMLTKGQMSRTRPWHSGHTDAKAANVSVPLVQSFTACCAPSGLGVCRLSTPA